MFAWPPAPPDEARSSGIEGKAGLVGDFDVETCPTIVIGDAQSMCFAGPLRRLLRARPRASSMP